MAYSLEWLFERFRRGGDPEALGRVFDATAPRLLQLAVHLVSDLAAAEDLVRTTFVTAIERASTFDQSRSLDAWLTCHPITIHPSSLVAGAVLAGVFFPSMSQTPVLNTRTVNVQYMPDPRDMVQIRQGTPYLVPAGNVFVLTGLGSNGVPPTGSVDLAVNGQQELVASGQISGANSVNPLPAGFSVQAGATIQVLPNNTGTWGRAWGYLAPQ